ncbi:MAG: hypothetical protein QXF78_05265 [Pyrobaculum sp.]
MPRHFDGNVMRPYEELVKEDKAVEVSKPEPVQGHETVHVLPKWIHELPGKIEEITKQLAELAKTVQALKPEPMDNCPTCGTQLPKSKAEEAKKRLAESAPVREVVREVPKEVEKVVEKPVVQMSTVAETIKRAFPERPSDHVVEAFNKFLAAARDAGWLK